MVLACTSPKQVVLNHTTVLPQEIYLKTSAPDFLTLGRVSGRFKSQFTRVRSSNPDETLTWSFEPNPDGDFLEYDVSYTTADPNNPLDREFKAYFLGRLGSPGYWIDDDNHVNWTYQLDNDHIIVLEGQNQELLNKIAEFEGEATAEINELKDANENLTTNLETAKTNISSLTEVIEQLSIDIANLKAKNFELETQITQLKFQHTITVAEMIKLKQEVAENKVLTDSKLNLLESKLVLAEKNLSTGNLTFDAFPQAAQENVAAAQTATLKIANQLSGNTLPSSSLEINTGQLVENNPFLDTFNNLLPNIQPNSTEVTDMQLSDLETAILAGITANFTDLGLPGMSSQLTNIENQTTPSAIANTTISFIKN
ncbi:MAG: hypothetical protein AB4372_38165 [Xenococcus sp. (in: cyanobacteria)]